MTTKPDIIDVRRKHTTKLKEVPYNSMTNLLSIEINYKFERKKEN